MPELSDPDILVVPTGVANLASVFAAIARLGGRPRLAESAREIVYARAVIVPGVGAFGPAMAALRTSGMAAALTQRFDQGSPTLAICLGMQLMCDGSDESSDTPGLGIVSGRVRRFERSVRSPQMGWNDVTADSECELLTSGCAYFANSYRLSQAPAGWRVACTEHGGQFVAALERGLTLACQFHPELSGAWGLSLIGRWMGRALAVQEAAPC